MLARRGCLEALYTDSCANQGVGRLLDAILPFQAGRGSIGKLLQRRIFGVPQNLVRSTDLMLWKQIFGTREVDRSFARRMRAWGIGKATHVYSMFGEGIDFLRFAKTHGLTICVDVFITPVAHRIISEERDCFPEWEGESTEWNPSLERRISEIIELADLLLCPHINVVEGVSAYCRDAQQKTRVVSYGSGANFGGRANKPVVGRVLFAGSAELRKGIHYFAAAADKLGALGYDFRVAGNVTERIRKLPACRWLTFLGRLPRGEMMEEILRADVLVLPTLAEGSASVIAEALVVGLPVITTRSAGSAVLHDRNGVLVPERNAEALAVAMQRVISDRSLRAALAIVTEEIASMLSEDAWSARLFGAFEPRVDKQG